MRCDRCEMYYQPSAVDCQPQSLDNSPRRRRALAACIITVMAVIIHPSPTNPSTPAHREQRAASASAAADAPDGCTWQRNGGATPVCVFAALIITSADPPRMLVSC